MIGEIGAGEWGRRGFTKMGSARATWMDVLRQAQDERGKVLRQAHDERSGVLRQAQHQWTDVLQEDQDAQPVVDSVRGEPVEPRTESTRSACP